MEKFEKAVVVILGAISLVGILGIPLGDPKFILQAVVLECCFIVLAVISSRWYRYAAIPNFIIAGVVIAGNSAFYKHIEIMATLHPLYNAIVLITGGYILQGLFLITNTLAYKQYRRLQLTTK